MTATVRQSLKMSHIHQPPATVGGSFCFQHMENEKTQCCNIQSGNEVSHNRWLTRLMTSATFEKKRQTMSYLWVTVGSALGGLLRYAITRLTISISSGIPFGTILINVL